MGSFEQNRELADKILVILFIISTTIANGALLLKYVFARRSLKYPTDFTKLTLSLGCMLLALYSYVFYVMGVFHADVDFSCSSWTLADTYQLLLFPFVFGFGIILMACDLYLRRYSVWNAHFTPISFAMSILPWIIGLVVVGPLALSGMDWNDECSINSTTSRYNAMQVISRLMPACLALLCSTFVMFLSKINKGNRVEALTNRNSTNSNEPINFNNANVGTAGSDVTTPYFGQSSDLAINYSSSAQTQALLPVTETNDSQSVQPHATRLEIRGLLWSGLIFFFSVMPYTCFTLHEMNHPISWNDRPKLLAMDVCFFASWLYPVFVPAVWIRQMLLR